MLLEKTKTFFLDLLFPITCLSCGTEGQYLCLACQARIIPPDQRCVTCSKGSLLGQIHAACQNQKIHLSGIMVAADYHQKVIRDLIWNLKYNSIEAIADTLSQLLADHLVAQDTLDYFDAAAVVPVPLHRKREKQRGYNQAALLAVNLAKRLNLEYSPVLKKTKKTSSQIDLERHERLENVRDSFAAVPPPSLGERKILLIDDVATTGATLNECAKVLHTHGAGEIWGLVVARN